MLDEAQKRRLRVAGERFHAAEAARDTALADLKEVLVDAAGEITDEEAAALTKVSQAAAHELKRTS
jgi:hypothetical protein